MASGYSSYCISLFFLAAIFHAALGDNLLGSFLNELGGATTVWLYVYLKKRFTAASIWLLMGLSVLVVGVAMGVVEGILLHM